MRFPEKRKLIMKRSLALGHCVCNPKQACPCDTLLQNDLCPCAGERPDPPKEEIRLTRYVRKAGCGSKISYADLNRVLDKLPFFPNPDVIIGVAAGDDAGVYRLGGSHHLVQTVDVFSPVVDDAVTFGRIAAANSLSDIYAMGGRPVCALSIIGFPIEELPHEVMADILRGGIETMNEAGVSVIGGHSINDEEIKCGFAVSGLVDPEGIITNDGAQPGDHLVLTKPIGTGFIAFAAQIGRASNEAVDLIGRSMATLNKDAAELMVQFGTHACTDVTGFSLAGHASEIAARSGVSIRIDLASVPVFAEALGCLRREIIPGANIRNRESFGEQVVATGEGDEALLDLLFDAQTSGGLLISLSPEACDGFVRAMRERGHDQTCQIGTVVPREDQLVSVHLDEPVNLVGTYREPEPAVTETLACCDHPPADLSCCDPATEVSAAVESESKTRSERKMMMKNVEQSAEAFRTFMGVTGLPGIVDARTKRLISIALSIAQRCAPCLKIHVVNALKEGITREEIEEVAWVAASFTGCTGRMFYQEMMKEITED